MFEELIRFGDQHIMAIDLDTIRAIEPDKKGTITRVHFKESATTKSEVFDISYHTMLQLLIKKNPSVYRKISDEVDVKLSEMAGLIVESKRFIEVAQHKNKLAMTPEYNSLQMENLIERLGGVHYIPVEDREESQASGIATA